MATQRYLYRGASECDYEVEHKAMDFALDLAWEENTSLIICCNQKQNFPPSALKNYLDNPNYWARILKTGGVIKIDDKEINVKFKLPKEIFGKNNCVILALYLTDINIKKVDVYDYLENKIIFVPWSIAQGDKWERTWPNKVIVQNGESRQINVFPEEVNQTLWLLDSSIHKHGLGTDDRKRIKDDLIKLYKAKFYLNIEELEAWAIRNRWAD